MSALDSTTQFKSTLDRPTVDFQSAQNLEHLYQQVSISESSDLESSELVASDLASSDLGLQVPSNRAITAQSPKHQKKSAAPAPSQFSPWLLSLAYPLGRYLVLPLRFGRIQVTGRENLPLSGPVILAPTHRSRWDSMMVPYAAGHHITGRHLRYMVSADEVTGLQGWFIRRMGGFPINTLRPAIASLRHGVDLLEGGESLVIFPEGNIFREQSVQPLKPGLARLAIQAQISNPSLDVKIVPMSIHYDKPLVPWGCNVKICIGSAFHVAEFCTGASKKNSQTLTEVLQRAMEQLVVSCIGGL